MPQNPDDPSEFPEVDSETLAQAIRTYTIIRQRALVNTGGANYMEVIRGLAEAMTSSINPSLAHFATNDETLLTAVQGQAGSSTPSLIFSHGGTVEVGQWVYLEAQDFIDLADSSAAALGPSVGVVTELISSATARVQAIGAFTYSQSSSLPFLPLVPDTTYFIDSSGAITNSPSPTAGGYVQEVGYAKTTHELVLSIQEPILV